MSFISIFGSIFVKFIKLHMIEYSQETIDNAKTLKCRFTLIILRNQCKHYIMNCINDSDPIQWWLLTKELDDLLTFYDNNGKLNEKFLLKLSDIKLVENIILVTRLIKLIKIC
jgi:hypothetical protein